MGEHGRGAFPDAVNVQIPEDARNTGVLQVTGTAEALQELARRRDGLPGTGELVQWCQQAGELAVPAVLHAPLVAGGFEVEHQHRVVLCRDAGEPAPMDGVLRQGAAECHPLVGVVASERQQMADAGWTADRRPEAGDVEQPGELAYAIAQCPHRQGPGTDQVHLGGG